VARRQLCDGNHDAYSPTVSTETNDSQVVAWIIFVDLPFVVSVADSLDDSTLRGYMEALEAGQRPDPVPYSPRLRPGFGFVIGAGSPVHLPNPDELADPFEVPVENGAARLRFLRRLRNVDRAIVTAGEFRPDRGTASFSSVRVDFDIGLSRTIERDDLQRAAELAVDAINRFLEVYRYKRGAYWAQPLDMADGTEFLILTMMEDGETLQPRVHASPGLGPLIGLGSKPLIDHTDADFRSSLVTAEMPFGYELKLSAQEHIHRGRHRNAVVDAATAFEVFLSELLRVCLSDAGRTPGEVDAVFRDAEDRPKTITTLAKDTLRTELGVDFASTAEYAAWRAKVAGPRNDLVHGGQAQATREQARDAVAHSQAAVDKLRALAEAAGHLQGSAPAAKR